MKKIMLLLVCILAFVSCEQEDVLSELQVKSNENELPLTRSAIDVPNAIEQLDGIPVNIKSVANGRYLSAESSGKYLYVAASDDGSLRQRWNIKQKGLMFRSNIFLVGGNDTFAPGYIQAFTNSSGSSYIPYLTSYFDGMTNIDVRTSSDGVSYTINTIGEVSPFPTRFRCMQPVKANSSSLIFDYPENKGDLVKWDIIPVDEFRIEEITYDLTTDDKLSVVPTQIATKTLVNDTDVAATRTLTFQETITNESSFSELVGLKITDKISATYKVAIAKFLDAEYTGETTSEYTWNYTVGQKETQTYTISETVTQEIPARTTIEAKLMATKYDATMTYIAKLYGINSGKTIYLKGKWNGVVVQESKIVLTQKGKVLRLSLIHI